MEIGTKVKHKSGGPEMVIASHDCQTGRDKVTTKWWNKISRNFESDVFDSFELIAIL